jgi:hypothetical protein
MAVYCYITFPTTYYALRAEDLLRQGPLSFKMVPVPRSISSSCGTALRCLCPDLQQVESRLLENRVEVEGTYEVEEKEFKLPRLFSTKEGPADET